MILTSSQVLSFATVFKYQLNGQIYITEKILRRNNMIVPLYAQSSTLIDPVCIVALPSKCYRVNGSVDCYFNLHNLSEFFMDFCMDETDTGFIIRKDVTEYHFSDEVKDQAKLPETLMNVFL